MERSKVIHDNYVLFDNGVILSLKTNEFIYGAVSHGYIRIKLNSSYYRLHRLLAEAFIENPNCFECVDHIDRDKSNNDLSNLRWCTQSQNSQNRSKLLTNTTGEIGIYKGLNNGKLNWIVQIWASGKRYRRSFTCDSDTIPKKVIDARDRLKRELHGEFAFF